MTDEPLPRRFVVLLLGLVLAAMVGVRVYLIISTDFPLNDGGLFLEFIRSNAAAFPGIPTEVSYNGLSIPFAYPPLSFWAGAFLTKLGFDALDVVRLFPLLMNIAYGLLFALLLLPSGQSRVVTVFTLIFFLVSARSYEWLVMGGGISRGFGSIFLLLALIAGGLSSGQRRTALPMARLLACGAAVGAAILSHLEWGLLATASIVVCLALQSPTLRDFIRSCVVTGATAFLLILPWVATVLAEHGLAPFLAAGQTSQSGLFRSMEQLLWLVKNNIFNIFLAFGGVALLWRREFFWIIFFLLCVFLTPRHGATPLVLPLSVFVGHGVVVAFHLFRLVVPSRALALAAIGIVFLATLFAQVRQERDERLQVLQPLSVEQREAMAWVKQNHPSARFALINSLPWWADRSAEWFPVLAGATSTTTVQGREWLPQGAFKNREEKVLALKASKTCLELAQRLKSFEPPNFVWVESMAHCFARPAYVPVFRNEDVIIFRLNRTDGTAA
jgi:hypothetical protein